MSRLSRVGQHVAEYKNRMVDGVVDCNRVPNSVKIVVGIVQIRCSTSRGVEVSFFRQFHSR